MKIYNVGSDELYDLNEIQEERFKWIVYWYEAGSYEGDGQLVAFGKDNLLYYTNLSHCSCYGPLDGFNGAKGITKKEFFKESNSIFDINYRDEILKKVKNLLKWKK